MSRWLLMMTFLALLAAPLPAGQNPDLEGQPTQLRAGAFESFWIWHDDSGYHLRTTTAHDRHVFSGRIEFTGGKGWVRAFELGKEDVVRLTGQGVEFHLSTQRNLNGFDFRMDEQNSALVELEIDGHKGKAVLEHTFTGQENSHPASNPFTIYP